MDERDWLAERFQEHRPRLRAVAYRMLGSTSEADDAVQEAWIRLSRSNAGEIDNLEAWLVTAVGRVALNMLRSRKARREVPLDALPDPIVDRADGPGWSVYRTRMLLLLVDRRAVHGCSWPRPLELGAYASNGVRIPPT